MWIRVRSGRGASSLPVRPRRKMSSCTSNQSSVSGLPDSTRHIKESKENLGKSGGERTKTIKPHPSSISLHEPQKPASTSPQLPVYRLRSPDGNDWVFAFECRSGYTCARVCGPCDGGEEAAIQPPRIPSFVQPSPSHDSTTQMYPEKYRLPLNISINGVK